MSYYARLVRQGEFRVIRVDGTETLYEEKPTLRSIYVAIGCTCIDTVILDRTNEIVMLVDDTGMLDGKAVNHKATYLYYGSGKPGTGWAIHGDVAIVNDRDFA